MALSYFQLPTCSSLNSQSATSRLRSRGKDLSAAQIETTTRLAIAACDAHDEVKDGVLGDPRQCQWSVKQAICGKPGGQARDDAESIATVQESVEEV